jgi:tetratricopeptide (TPR) repeat protein
MNRRPSIIMATAAAVVVAVGAVFGWRAHDRRQLVEGAVPARPSLVKFPTELLDRVYSAETAARRKGSIDALKDLATLYDVNGFVAESERCYQGLMQLEPKNAKWPHRIATNRAGYGELDVAIQLWEYAVQFAPDYIPIRIRLGDAYLKTNRDADAAKAYEAVLQREPANPYALVGLARLDLKSGNAVRAKERLEHAAEQSNWAIGTDLLVSVYEQLGDNDRAIALRARTKSAGTYFDPPDPWIDGMLDDCYDIFRLTLGAGFAEHRGDPATARRILERAAVLAPKDGHVFLQLGLLCRGTNDLESARKYLEHSADVDPTLSDAWAQLVDLYAAMGDRTRSTRALSLGLSHCPLSPGLHLERGRRLAAAGQVDAAIADFRESFRLRPEEADPLIEIAELELRRNNTEEAIKDLHRALDSEPDHPVALMTLALYSIGVGDERGARNWLRRAQLQVRVPRDALAQLISQYGQRFGHAFVADPGFVAPNR